ncbi:hypothetical protein D3C79_733220 [compost metagenome]
MTELVTQLGETQGDGEGDHAAEAEQVRKGRQKALPVTHHQQDPQPQYQRQAIAQKPGPEARQPRPGAIEEGIRAPERNAEKQVLVQQLGPDPLALVRGLERVAAALFIIAGRDQVVATQETQQFFHGRRRQRHPRFAIGGGQDLCRVAQCPVAQQAHCRGTELEIAPAQRVGQGPLWRAVQPR